MVLLLILFFLVLNGAICWWNCFVIGSSWHTVANEGSWWQKTVVYSAVVQSALGFTWCFSIILSGILLLYSFMAPSKLSHEDAMSIFELFNGLTYLIIVPGIVISGLALMVQSWVQAYRTRSLASGVVAGWNTFAQLSNTISMFRHIGPVFDAVRKAATDNLKKNVFVVALCLAVLSLIGGIYLTYRLIEMYAAKAALTAPDSPRSVEYVK